MPIPLQLLTTWTFESPRFRTETIDQIELVISLCDDYVAQRIPPEHHDLERLRGAARQRAFTRLFERFLRAAPSRVEARRLWKQARHAAPRSRARASCPPVIVDREVGHEFFRRFHISLTLRELRDAGANPELTTFGFLIERVSLEDFDRLVRAALDEMPSLQEVIARASPSSSSQPSL